VKVLLNHGADANTQTEEGKTALMKAAKPHAGNAAAAASKGSKCESARFSGGNNFDVGSSSGLWRLSGCAKGWGRCPETEVATRL